MRRGRGAATGPAGLIRRAGGAARPAASGRAGSAMVAWTASATASCSTRPTIAAAGVSRIEGQPRPPAGPQAAVANHRAASGIDAATGVEVVSAGAA